MGEQFEAIVKHFGTYAALLIATWGFKTLLSKRSGCGPESKNIEQELEKSASYRLLAHPELQFQPATPGWLCQWTDLAPSETAEPPQVQIALEKLASQSHPVQLGEDSVRKELFLLQTDVAAHFLNAGSYGAVYRLAAEAQNWYQNKLEHEPVHFHESLAPVAMQAAKQCMAAYIHASAADIVHMVNATTAVNTVLHSTLLQPGDLVLVTSIGYAAVCNAVARFAARAGAGVVEVVLDLDTLQQGQDTVLARFQSVLTRWGSRIRLAVVDHITSAPTFHLPVAEVASACRELGIKVCIDGAHAVGAVPLDVPSLGAHFYTSNLHKWGCCPKSAAFLWVHADEQRHMVPLVTSHGFATGFQGEFAWQGTSDISAWLAVPTALRVQQALGTDRVQQHNHNKLLNAVAMLQQAWGHLATLGANAPCSHMASLELPSLPGYSTDAAAAQRLHRHLIEECKIEVPVSAWEGRLWLRISAQIFNTTADYRALRDAVLDLAAPRTRQNGFL